MANMVDSDSSIPGNLDQLEKDLAEAVQASTIAASDDKKTNGDHTPDVEEADLPEKFRGKSRKEIVDMYKNLESSHGRMANDLGQQRALTDRLLNLKRESDLQDNGQLKAELPQLQSSDLLEDPTGAIDKVVEARIKQRESQAEQSRRETEAALAAQAFVTAHPDYQSFVGDPNFNGWVQASQTRKRLAANAASGDWGAATDLLTEYKEIRAKATDDKGDKNLENARKASLESAASSTAANKGGKVYRRADLLRLKAERPDVYYDDTFQEEILKAYAEKRVK